MSSAAPVKRACDSCHRRKVKCIGDEGKPCKNCMSAGLSCTYNAIPQKKGPKGSRAKVLSELRETQRQTQVPGSLEAGFEGSPMSPMIARTSGLLNHDLINACAEFYLANLYSSQPILYRDRFQDLVVAMDHSVDAYCLLAAFSAAMLTQTNITLPPSLISPDDSTQAPNLRLGSALLDETMRIRKMYNNVDNPSTITVMTSFYMFVASHSLDRENMAWYYLREATTQAVALGMHDESTYKDADVVEMAKRRRLFWLLFLNERAYALSKHRSLTLQPTIQLPSVGEDPTEQIPISGFIHLINLYRPLDNIFMALWNKTIPTCVPSWLAQLQQQLSDALPSFLDATEAQVVDLRINQLWLKTMVWQLAISHGFISSATGDNAMSFKYPIDISRDLSTMSQQFSQHSMEVHGIGLVEKLFDIACTLADVIACVPMSQPAYEPSPRDYLARFLNLVSTLRGGQNRYVPLLAEKIGEVLPEMTMSMPRSVSTTSSPPSGDIFGTGSHSATPVGQPSYEHPAPVPSQHVGPALHYQGQQGQSPAVGPGPHIHGFQQSVPYHERVKQEAELHGPNIYPQSGHPRGPYRG